MNYNIVQKQLVDCRNAFYLYWCAKTFCIRFELSTLHKEMKIEVREKDRNRVFLNFGFCYVFFVSPGCLNLYCSISI